MDKAKQPVVYITWKDADAYCKADGKRLLTEEEWEAAGRGPKGYRFPWGNEWQENKTNTAEAGFRVPVDVGKFDDVSPFGVHDMFGNVQEWTSSWFKAYPGNAKGNPNFGDRFRVTRGLSSRYINSKRSALWARPAYLPSFLADFGCRCAKDATAEEAAKAAPAK
jgi:formylglycine-generating enzyme required for sulfatase activity